MPHPDGEVRPPPPPPPMVVGGKAHQGRVALAAAAAWLVTVAAAAAAGPAAAAAAATPPTASWMGAYPDARLVDLALPASHHSAAYTAPPLPPADPLGGLFSPNGSARRDAAADILEAAGVAVGQAWALTQVSTVRAQLDGGVRFLDLRLRDRGGTVWTAHRWYLVPLAVVVADVAAFVAAHPSEVVVVKLRRDWDNRPADEVRAAALATALAPLAPYVVPPSDRAVPVGALAAAGKRVVLLMGNEDPVLVSPLPTGVWTDAYATRWWNTPWGGELCAVLGGANASAWTVPGAFNMHQPLLTPTLDTIVDATVAGLVGDAVVAAPHPNLRAAAAAVNRDVVLPWLASLPVPWSGVVATDVTSAAIVSAVLRLNDRSRPRAAGATPFACDGASCGTSAHCPPVAAACDTRPTAGDGRRWRCWPAGPLGAACARGGDCRSGECGSLRRRCVCRVCGEAGCGGCGTSEVCEPQPVVGNGCKRAPAAAGSVGRGGKCRRSSECVGGCCALGLGGRACTTKAWYRVCV